MIAGVVLACQTHGPHHYCVYSWNWTNDVSTAIGLVIGALILWAAFWGPWS